MTWQSGSTTCASNTQDVVRIDTSKLRDRLNTLYDCLRANYGSRVDSDRNSHFVRLWDIKEQALISKEQSVQIPRSWLDELENLTAARDPHAC